MILWKRLDCEGHEAARLDQLASGAGSSCGVGLRPASFLPPEAGQRPALHDRVPVHLGTVLRGMAVLTNTALAYRVTCDDAWRTISARVDGWAGERELAIAIESNGGRWTMNGVHVPEVEGCVDVDLNFSPSTNLLPIRRLNLAIGEEATVRAAWLRFPSFTLEPLDQTYRRTGEHTYRYQSASFTAEIAVNEDGLVLEYGPWVAV